MTCHHWDIIQSPVTHILSLFICFYQIKCSWNFRLCLAGFHTNDGELNLRFWNFWYDAWHKNAELSNPKYCCLKGWRGYLRECNSLDSCKWLYNILSYILRKMDITCSRIGMWICLFSVILLYNVNPLFVEFNEEIWNKSTSFWSNNLQPGSILDSLSIISQPSENVRGKESAVLNVNKASIH